MASGPLVGVDLLLLLLLFTVRLAQQKSSRNRSATSNMLAEAPNQNDYVVECKPPHAPINRILQWNALCGCWLIAEFHQQQHLSSHPHQPNNN